MNTITRFAHKHLDEQQRIRLAKAMYHIGGWFWAHVRIYQRYYIRDKNAPDGFRKGGRHWIGPGWPLKLGVITAEDVDPVHFPHWAYMHGKCTERCPVCGGMRCPGEGCWPD